MQLGFGSGALNAWERSRGGLEWIVEDAHADCYVGDWILIERRREERISNGSEGQGGH